MPRVRHNPIPAKPGWTCLSYAFPHNHQTVVHVARSIGVEIHEAAGMAYVPNESLGLLLATIARRAQEAQDASTLTHEHVSCAILEKRLHFKVKHFADQLGIALKFQYGDYFIHVDELPGVMLAARAAQAPGDLQWQTSDEAIEKTLEEISEHGLHAITRSSAGQRGLIPRHWLA
jgi:hypothetical protein